MVLLAQLWHGLVAVVCFAIWTPFVLAFLALTLVISIGAGLALFGLLREAAFGMPGLAPITEPWEYLLVGAICLLTSALGVSLWIRQFEVDRIFRSFRGVFGSARLARRHEVRALTRTGGLLIGRDPRSGELLRYDGPAHLLTLAPTRSGKGVGTVIPNLLAVDRSVLCIDPKGENARIAGAARAAMGPLYILDPFGASGQPSAAYNPLDRLTPDSLDLGEDAATLAEALVVETAGQVSDAHWNEEARALLAGLILFCVCHEKPERRTLPTVREYLTLPPAKLRALLELMQDSLEARGLIARGANRFLGKSDREAAGVLSSAQRHTHFLDSPRIAATLARSDFAFADLRTGLTSIFLVLPPNRLDAYGRWLRLLVAQAIGEVARASETSREAPGASPAPVLFLLDEFAALGRLEAVERAMGLMAGYGVQLWPILQDLSQLRDLYGTRAGTFVANAGVLQCFGVNDVETARWLSQALGKTTVAYETSSWRAGDEGRAFSEHLAARDLMTPDEIMQLPEHVQLLRLHGHPAILALKLRYYADQEFQGLFEATET